MSQFMIQSVSEYMIQSMINSCLQSMNSLTSARHNVIIVQISLVDDFLVLAGKFDLSVLN